MRHVLWVVAALAVVAGRPATAGEIQFKPIDTNNLVVQPSKAAAALTSATINMVGKTAAGSIEQNGYVKTINNLFGFRKTLATPTQPGRSSLPAPFLFPSTQYKSFNTPVMPTSVPVRR
ncbi:MAG: hypothetical protein JWO38_6684 [Gemmataceae bacterium]|nr:hypothetical protein [Gemmataceae bacterium]